MLTSSRYVPVDEISKYNFMKLWVISSNWWRDKKINPNVVLVRKWLNDHLKLISTHEMDGLKIYGYEKKQPGLMGVNSSFISTSS
jgi:hypothetical protein